jgi:hypothetical protein
VNTGSDQSGWVDRRVGDGDAESAADTDASAAGELPSGSEVQVASKIRTAAAGAHRDHIVVQEPLAELMGITVIQLMVVSVTCQNRMPVLA